MKNRLPSAPPASRGTDHLIRSLGWWPIAVVMAIWIAAVGWPMLALAPPLVRSAQEGATAVQPGFKSMGELLLTSLQWAMMVALASALVGWLPGRLLGGLLQRRGFVPLAAFVLVPICLPSYLVYYAWWQSWPPGTALHDWVIARHAVQVGREATLLLSLVCWSWPLVALCVAGAAARRPRSRDEMLLVDGAPRLRRGFDQLCTDAPGLGLGMLLVLLATLNNTTCFDLAEVFTFANELRARAALNASPAQVLYAGLPMIVIAACGAAAVWLLSGRRAVQTATQTGPSGSAAFITTIAIWLITVFVPIALFWHGVAKGGDGINAISNFIRLYGSNTLATLSLALMSGATSVLLTFGLAMMWHSDRRVWRLLAHVMSVTWLLWSLLPGTILGLALHEAYGSEALATVILRSPVILIIAHLACAGFVPVLLARWSVEGEPRTLHDLRRIDGAQTLRGLWLSAWPSMLAAAFASAAIVTVLSLGEIAVTAQVVPPMPIEQTPLAMTLLNDMHYQRPQTVLSAALLLIALSIIAALAIAFVWRSTAKLRPFSSHSPTALALSLLTILLTGCAPDTDAPLDPDLIFGSPGQARGQFGYPRAIDVDVQNHWVYVIDKTARVQRFTLDGEAQREWHMPESQQGKPTGVSVGPNGHVYVADTHYFRVIEYDSDGNLINAFGEYGEGPGQFIYVTDIAFAPDGRLYVSEYGGHDRVQVFTPDGRYLFEFGSFGRDHGQFNRPQSLAFSRDGKELFINDACNHRVVVTDPQGHWLRTFGSAGREPGQLCYPYGLEVLPDDTLLVAEFGNNRIQRFHRNGRSLGVYGRIGRSEGELQYPWAVAAGDDQIFVLDSGNNRVQVLEMF